jgi:hypothetical protein
MADPVTVPAAEHDAWHDAEGGPLVTTLSTTATIISGQIPAGKRTDRAPAALSSPVRGTTWAQGRARAWEVDDHRCIQCAPAAAKNRSDEIAVDQRRNVFYNPTDGTMLFRDFVQLWKDAHDVSDTTWARYQSHLDIHILPKWGDTQMAGISRMAIKGWEKDLKRRRALATVGIAPIHNGPALPAYGGCQRRASST